MTFNGLNGLHIILDDSYLNRAFIPGDRIHGKVVSVLPPDDVKDAQIIFKGVIRTSIRHGSGENRHTAREEVNLFRYVQPATIQTSTTADSKAYEWSFDFTLPHSATYACGTGLFGNQQGLLPSGERPLPPSFNSDNYPSWSSGRHASIVYSVKFKIASSSLFHKKEAKLIIHLLGAEMIPRPRSDLQAYQLSHCKWSSASLRPQQHSFKEKMRHAFTDDPNLKTPSIFFKPKMTLCNVMSMSQTCPVQVGVDWYKLAKTDPDAPTIQLRALWFEIGLSTRISAESHQRDETCTIPRTVFNNLNIDMPLDGSLVTALPAWGPSHLKGSLTPAFQTWTVIHSQTLKMGATFVHVESGHIFNADVVDYRFLLLRDGQMQTSKQQMAYPQTAPQMEPLSGPSVQRADYVASPYTGQAFPQAGYGSAGNTAQPYQAPGPSSEPPPPTYDSVWQSQPQAQQQDTPQYEPQYDSQYKPVYTPDSKPQYEPQYEPQY